MMIDNPAGTAGRYCLPYRIRMDDDYFIFHSEFRCFRDGGIQRALSTTGGYNEVRFTSLIDRA